jgi:hypothetical protein
VICSPLAKVHRAVQPVIGALPALTVTVLWKPPPQVPVTVDDAEQDPPGAGLGALPITLRKP